MVNCTTSARDRELGRRVNCGQGLVCKAQEWGGFRRGLEEPWR